MTRRYFNVAALAIAALLLPKCDVEACGPFFEPDVFVSSAAPDDRVAFASGQLGILQAGFDSNDYAVAYRYLNGGKLSEAEHRAYAPPVVHSELDEDWWMHKTLEQRVEIQKEQEAAERARQAARPPNVWLAERAKFLPVGESVTQKPSFPTDWQGHIVINEDYLNCPDPAFQNATLTLTERAASWTKDSPWLADWIHGQDAVFANCAAKAAAMPAPAPSGSPALLKADRAYQIASANFYAGHFDDAAQQFAAIAADRDSAWSTWGTYLAARATVRKAFSMGKETNPWSGELATYDDATMRRAQQMLESLLVQPHPTPSRAIIQSELNFIRIRTEPAKRVAELSAALAGPATDANFAQDLQDLNFLLIKHIKLNEPAPLLDWISAWRGAGTAATAYATWQQTHALPWLVMALVKASPDAPFAHALISDAQKIAPHTPGYDTAFFHRVRLLIGLKRTDEARALLDEALPALQKQKASSNLNALLGERMSVARSFAEFLEFAPRRTLSSGSQGSWDLKGQCNQQARAVNGSAPCPEADRPVEFDDDAVQILNEKTPLPLLIEAANSSILPKSLRDNIAIMAWTRSVLLEDAQSAAALAPLLPKKLSDTAGTSVGFPADLAILRNPGVRPDLEAGVPRVASYSYFDEFRNNWWCRPSVDQRSGPAVPRAVPDPVFLPAERIALADSQVAQLQKLPNSATVIGQRVLAYAKDHPSDPLVPEALALTVRATHYACQVYDYNSPGGPKSEYTPTSKAAFELLHRNYPKSPWTGKTPYYY